MREERRVISPVVRSVSLKTEGKRMSKPSDKIIGNTKKIVGEVLGDGKLVEEGDRQMSQGNSERPERDDDRPRGGPLGINDLT
jgi:uncharacterized protein YjbJ (UPF0337 family)